MIRSSLHMSSLNICTAEVDVLHDSRDRFSPGKGVRTSFLAARDEGPFFITNNTVYALLGPGRRKRAEFDSLSLLF